MRKKRGRSIRVYSKGKPDLSLAPELLKLIARLLYDKVNSNKPLEPSSDIFLEQTLKDNKRR